MSLVLLYTFQEVAGYKFRAVGAIYLIECQASQRWSLMRFQNTDGPYRLAYVHNIGHHVCTIYECLLSMSAASKSILD